MQKNKSLTVIYGILSFILCTGMILFLNTASFDTMAQEIEQKPSQEGLTPVQQVVYDHIEKLENPQYRKVLIYQKISKILEESYTEASLRFADTNFVPKAGKVYTPKDIVVTDSALILKKYADISDDTDPARLTVLNTGSCLIDAVPYFWGGKTYNKGWNKLWGQDVVVSGGSFIAETAFSDDEDPRYANAEGTEVLVPYGLDCSGFVNWAYNTALGYKIGNNTREQFENSNPITEEELLPGDLGFLCDPSEPMINHVGMYIGKNKDGKMMWLHCTSPRGVCISSPEFAYYRRPNIDIYYTE